MAPARSASSHPPQRNAIARTPARVAASTSYGVSPISTASSDRADAFFSAPWTMSGSGLDSSASPLLRSEEHMSELQSRGQLVCRLLLEKKKKQNYMYKSINRTKKKKKKIKRKYLN